MGSRITCEPPSFPLSEFSSSQCLPLEPPEAALTSLPTCCASCLPHPLLPGEDLLSPNAKLVYVPAKDYFNCPSSPRPCPSPSQPRNITGGGPGVHAPPDGFSFVTRDAEGARSAAGTQLVWVRGVNDPPRLVGASEMVAVTNNISLLPPLSLLDDDYDAEQWELEVSAVCRVWRHGKLRG